MISEVSDSELDICTYTPVYNEYEYILLRHGLDGFRKVFVDFEVGTVDIFLLLLLGLLSFSLELFVMK